MKEPVWLVPGQGERKPSILKALQEYVTRGVPLANEIPGCWGFCRGTWQPPSSAHDTIYLFITFLSFLFATTWAPSLKLFNTKHNNTKQYKTIKYNSKKSYCKTQNSSTHPKQQCHASEKVPPLPVYENIAVAEPGGPLEGGTYCWELRPSFRCLPAGISLAEGTTWSASRAGHSRHRWEGW